MFVLYYVLYILCCLLCFASGKVLALANLQRFSMKDLVIFGKKRQTRWSVSLEHLAFCTGGSCVNACLFSLEMIYTESAEMELFV